MEPVVGKGSRRSGLWWTLRIASVIAVIGAYVLLRPGETSRLADTDESSVEVLGQELTPSLEATPTPAASPTATPIPSPTPEPTVTVSMSFSGDVLSHSGVYRQALTYGVDDPADPAALQYDYRPMFSKITDRLSAVDLSICVLETPVSATNEGLAGYPVFNAPRELPDALLAVGFDGCATASNHSYDRGADGVITTLDQLDRAGLRHAGMARSADEAASPTLYAVGDVNVAHLSFTYGLNGFVLPVDRPWLVDVIDVEQILTQARAARAAGADLVVLSIQWGNEYDRNPTSEQIRLADELTRSGEIDLIAGNHAHVVQPIDVVNDTWVLYGLGNLLSNQSSECCIASSQDGVLVTVTFEGLRSTGLSVVDVAIAPTWVDRSDYTIISLLDEIAQPDLDEAARSSYIISRDRTIEAIGLLGRDIRLAE